MVMTFANRQCARPRIANRKSKVLALISVAIICVTGLLGFTSHAAEPTEVARWDFGTETTSLFSSHGSVLRDQAGPRPPEFPDFEANNTAIRLDEKGAYLSIADPGTDSHFDFTNGDAITLEAWVNLDYSESNFAARAPVYIIGKGRTGNPRMVRDNQNWALRLTPSDGSAKISFLFATKPGPGDAHWHRWTSHDSLDFAAGWHHVAVAYRFGEPDSIRGWINGISTKGQWDMGGATTDQPVMDNDEIWIGTANKGNSFTGSLDAVAIHRAILTDDVMAKRFRRVGEPRVAVKPKSVMPTFDSLPRNQVLVTFSEGYPSPSRWLDAVDSDSKETTRWIGDAFLMRRIPQRYDAWGIRDDWKSPLLVRMAADVELTPGAHRFLLRTRGLGRLWIDGQIVAETSAYSRRSPDGEQPVTPVAKPPMPGLRVHGYHQQEVFGEASIPPDERGTVRRCRVVLELIVGGSGQRTETGEVTVAVESADGSSFDVLTPSQSDRLPLTNAAVEPFLDRLEASLTDHDDQTRRQAAASQDAFWEQRHRLAGDWIREFAGDRFKTAAVTDDPTTAQHPIDQFIANKITRLVDAAAETDSKQTKTFHEQVLPLLRDQCFRCHGEKDRGGLKLNSRDSALLAGDSELPAVVAGDPESSELIAQVRSGAMPPTGAGLSEQQIGILEQWIRDGALWPAPPVTHDQVAMSPIIDDQAFLRRVFLDTVGVPPTVDESERFLQDDDPDKRSRLIDRLLEDERIADQWVSYWQDVLAENPTLLNQSIGSTGPFRWFIYESLRDHKPVDRFVTELIMLRGSVGTGGSAAFGLAGESDSPFAAKSHIVAAAFLGIELQCARCHDSPYHSTTQRDLYSLAAMMKRQPLKVPATSRVPDAFFEKKGRESLIKVTLKPDELVDAVWPFDDLMNVTDNEQLNQFMLNPNDTRERLAAQITAPQNLRFARVIANRVWKRLIGAGLVEPVDDWEGHRPSHPELLDWLAIELVANHYDLRHLMRQILRSQLYMRQATGNNLAASEEMRLFNAPDRRRLSAEQIVDSLHVATGNKIDSEELTFVHDGQRPLAKRQTLGCPQRAWMFAGLNNERDRPSLSLPKARAIVDVLQAFGWNGNRQKPVSSRDTDPNVLQPGVLSNGTLATTLTRASFRSEVANLAIAAESAESLVDEWFLRVLCRQPNREERQVFVAALNKGFESRVLPADQVVLPDTPSPLPLVTWFNHLRPETSTIQQENERRVLHGPPVDPRLESHWRSVYEDFIWSLINHREFVWIP